MSEQQDFRPCQDALRQVLNEADHEGGASSGTGKSGPGGRGEPLAGKELQRRIVDRVIDAGGEVTGLTLAGDSVRVRGRIGCRSEIAMLDRELHQIPGISRLELRFAYDIDDTRPAAEPDRP